MQVQVSVIYGTTVSSPKLWTKLGTGTGQVVDKQNIKEKVRSKTGNIRVLRLLQVWGCGRSQAVRHQVESRGRTSVTISLLLLGQGGAVDPGAFKTLAKTFGRIGRGTCHRKHSRAWSTRHLIVSKLQKGWVCACGTEHLLQGFGGLVNRKG